MHCEAPCSVKETIYIVAKIRTVHIFGETAKNSIQYTTDFTGRKLELHKLEAKQIFSAKLCLVWSINEGMRQQQFELSM